MLINNQISTLSLQGNLMIDSRPYLNTQCMITSWNEGICFYIKIDGQWKLEEIDPGFILVSDDYCESDTQAAYFYMQQIPHYLRESIKPFTLNQFILLSLLSHHPSLLDIFKHSPNIVWLVVVESIQQKWDKEFVVKLLQQKRKKIINEVIGLGTKSMVTFINKVTFFAGDEYEFELIKDCLSNLDIIYYFLHWKSIPIHALLIFRKFPIILQTDLLNLIELDTTLSPIKQQKYFYSISCNLQDIVRMSQVMNIELPDYYFKQFKTEVAIQRAHDRMINQLNESYMTSNKKVSVFPLCPLGNTEQLIQIKNSFELSREGRDMHHCVGSYSNSLTGGNGFIYKVLAPERGTLYLRKRENKFDIKQFRLVCNKKPSEESQFKIRQWLESNGKN
jgi:hypothetical protein